MKAQAVMPAWLSDFNTRNVKQNYILEKERKTMNITDVRIRMMNRDRKMKAVVSITIDEVFVIHDIKVIEGEKGVFIAMPSRKTNEGEYKDIAHPINSDTRNMIQDIILKKYEEALETDLEKVV